MALTKIISGNPLHKRSVVSNVNQLGRITSIVYGENEPNYNVLGDANANSFMHDGYITIPVSGNVGNTTLVELAVGKQIEVVNYSINTSVASTVRFASSGNFISGPFALAANGVVSHEGESLRTSVSEPLVISNTAGVVGGHLTYKIL